jgi:ribosomal protein S18 acetylase RimI-like enzyme
MCCNTANFRGIAISRSGPYYLAMMKISNVTGERIPRWTAADRSFLVEQIGSPRLENERLVLESARVEPYLKTYTDDEPSDTLDAASEVECYVAFVGDQPAGELQCGPHWNGYLYIHDLVVGATFRRQGIGKAPVRHAKERARSLELRGVMLETQNTNLPACRLYERCGFVLGGFDRLLYKALEPNTMEVALFWYWTSAQGLIEI